MDFAWSCHLIQFISLTYLSGMFTNAIRFNENKPAMPQCEALSLASFFHGIGVKKKGLQNMFDGWPLCLCGLHSFRNCVCTRRAHESGCVRSSRDDGFRELDGVSQR